MSMRDITVNELTRASFEDAERTFQMTEETFRVFYDQTSRPLWVYLARTTGDARLADDLLQETYYRFLRAGASFESDDHRRHYLFRVAMNLVRDHRRKPQLETATAAALEMAQAEGDQAERAARRLDLSRAMEQLTARDRALLWLAYGQGCSHEEIATRLGLRTGSLKTLLFRARRRLAGLMGGRS